MESELFKYFSILSLMFLVICQTANAADLLSKDAFYAKHHIENNSIISPSFDENECRRVLTNLYNKRYENIVEEIKDDMVLPEQYEGFYPPQDKIIFYNTLYQKNVHKLGLTDKDIKELNLEVTAEMLKQWHMGMTEQQLKEHGFYTALYTARLLARVGKNIYLIGDYTDCGTAGCLVRMAVRNKNFWTFPRAELRFAFCIANDHKSKYECDIVGGQSVSWRFLTADYKPLNELLNKYYEVYADYVEQYLQRKNNINILFDF